MDKEKVILTIDDDQDFNILLKKKLEKFESLVVTTDNTADFLNQLKLRDPDLCLIDLNLGESLGAGFQLIQAIRKVKGYDLPLVVLSRRSSQEDLNYALELGADDFLFKPIDDLVLNNKIPLYLEHEPQEDRLSLRDIPSKYRDCVLDFDVDLVQINEFTIILRSEAFIPRGVSLKLQGSFINQILQKDVFVCTVHNSWLDKKDNHFYFDIEIDSSNIDMVRSLRNWLCDKTG